MFHVSVQEFKEYVRRSHSWSELARRCDQPEKFGRFCSSRCITILKQKVLFLKLDTQHFTRMQGMKTRIAEISAAEFTEFVYDSKSWSDLAIRCGSRAIMNNGGYSWRLVKLLKQKVLCLNLDTQHFTSMPKRVRIAERVGEVGERRLTVWGTSINASLVALQSALQTRLAELEASEASEATEAGAAGACGEVGKVGRGGEIDELTCRLISLKNTVINEGQLRLLHGCVRGHTLEELETYVKLWRHMGHTLEGLETYVELWRRVVDEREDYVRKYPTNVGEMGENG